MNLLHCDTQLAAAWAIMSMAQRRCNYVRCIAAGSTAVLPEGANSPSEWSVPVMMASMRAVGKPSRRSGASSRRRRAKARGSLTDDPREDVDLPHDATIDRVTQAFVARPLIARDELGEHPGV